MRRKNKSRRVFFFAETTTRTTKLDKRRGKRTLIQLPQQTWRNEQILQTQACNQLRET